MSISFDDQMISSLGCEGVIDAEEGSHLIGYELAKEAEQLRAAWAAMSLKRRAEAWDRFTRGIDEGGAGWNRFHPILWPAYETGASIL